MKTIEEIREASRIRQAAYRARHPERVKQSKMRYRNKPETKLKEAEYAREYVKNHREEIKAKARERRKNNPEQARIYDKKKIERIGLETSLAKLDAWKSNNRERLLKTNVAKSKRWAAANPHKRTATETKRRATKLQATPKWANSEAIQQVYLLAQFMTSSTGIKWHVDHAVPLKNKNVCGLHVEHNLVFIPGSFNVRKSNKFDDWADYPL